MKHTYAVRDLFDSLKEDTYRRGAVFNSDVEKVHRVLFHPFSDYGDYEEVLSAWFQRHQPCLFGRVSAAMGTLHFQFLTDRDLTNSDQHIAAKIREGLAKWRQRSLAPKAQFSVPAHGFVLVLVSSRLAFAEPDATMHALALEVLRLWGCRKTVEPHGELFWEDLYLENPSNGGAVKFTFTVDFFAAAGDVRWWQDHRVPGGLAFTANSLGHMRRFREWYEGKIDQTEWGLATAMETIARAAETPFGKATWLRELADGKPFLAGVRCPLKTVRPSLVGKDWTRYGGHLHTDHAVRRELFRAAPEKSAQLLSEEWLEDFQYLYDPSSPDYAQFVEGVPVSPEEVLAVVGAPEGYTRITGPRPRKSAAGLSESDRGQLEELNSLLDDCREWRLSQSELQALLES
ncbi:MAG: hypothetical protein K1X67_16815 [Fimbriimonadaceae bacterium]|nr:hypothetical protein [Fimbriimonadaceae bacterium]